MYRVRTWLLAPALSLPFVANAPIAKADIDSLFGGGVFLSSGMLQPSGPHTSPAEIDKRIFSLDDGDEGKSQDASSGESPTGQPGEASEPEAPETSAH